jgi:hypothetical protein
MKDAVDHTSRKASFGTIAQVGAMYIVALDAGASPEW